MLAARRSLRATPVPPTLRAKHATAMDDLPTTGCPTCAELWKRIDQLTEERVRAQRLQGVNTALSVVLFLMLCAGVAIKLVS